jgi:hypothetical protein
MINDCGILAVPDPDLQEIQVGTYFDYQLTAARQQRNKSVFLTEGYLER